MKKEKNTQPNFKKSGQIDKSQFEKELEKKNKDLKEGNIIKK